jgi:hypothetical protein
MNRFEFRRGAARLIITIEERLGSPRLSASVFSPGVPSFHVAFLKPHAVSECRVVPPKDSTERHTLWIGTGCVDLREREYLKLLEVLRPLGIIEGFRHFPEPPAASEGAEVEGCGGDAVLDRTLA